MLYENKNLKPLPIGESDLASILGNNCIYIDRDINGGKNILQCLTNKLCNKERPLFLQRNS